MDAKGFKLPFSRNAALVALMLCISGLVAASLGVNYFQGMLGDSELMLKLVKKLDLDSEANNLPTWYQASTLLLTSFLLLTIAIIRKGIGATDIKFWMFLGAVFAYLSLDESISIHEQVTVPLRSVMPATGIFFFAWVIPAMLIVAVIFLLCLKTLLSLPAATRNLMMASGALFMFGAVGLEMVGGSYYEVNLESVGVADMTYVVMTTFEEFFEMAGIALFLFTLLRFIEEECLVASFKALGSARSFSFKDDVADGLFSAPTGTVKVNLATGNAPRGIARTAQHEFSNQRVLRPRFSK